MSLIHIRRITCIDTLQRLEMPGKIDMLEKETNGFQERLLIFLEAPPPDSLAHL
jgi:hypothetical protein